MKIANCKKNSFPIFGYRTLLLVALLGLIHCSSEKTHVLVKQSPEKSVEDLESLPEGFINSNTFQVVVSSVNSDPKQAESEAVTVAQKKSFQVLQTYVKQALTSEGKTELKEISESGKITKKSLGSKKSVFLYQIQKQGLESQVKTRIR